jgi:hypothetical protein
LDACAHLETTKEDLHAYFRAKYDKPLPAPLASVASTSTINDSPQKVDFTSHYRNLPQAFTDEVQEYFKLPHENFDACDPLQWWAGHCSQFPNLSCFARDILSIPSEFTTDSDSLFLIGFYAGSAVAVEWIFLRSHDTISLHRARLNPETIRTLMLVKQQLPLTCTAVHKS